MLEIYSNVINIDEIFPAIGDNMDMKILALIAVAVVVVGGGAAAAVVITNNNNNDSDDDELSTDAAMIAASFSKNYTGFFGTDFYLADGYTTALAKAYYPNGSTSGYGSDSNHITFQVFETESEAKDAFDTNKADYTNTIGTPAMGAVRTGTTVTGGLDDAIGYYSNVNMGSPFIYLYYTGYEGNAFFEGYIYIKNTAIEDEDDITDLAKAIHNAIENPVETSEAKTYVAPDQGGEGGEGGEDPPSYTGVALRCYNFTDNAKAYGSYATQYTMTEDSTAMSAKLQDTSGAYYLEMKIVPGGASDTYDEAATSINSEIDKGTVMGATVTAITEKTGVTDGIGYWYNATAYADVFIYDYACYKDTYFAHAHLRSETQITAETAANLANAVITAMTA